MTRFLDWLLGPKCGRPDPTRDGLLMTTQRLSYELRHVIGIDPGPTPGFVVLTRRGMRGLDVDVIQCSQHIAPTILWTLLTQCRESLGSAGAVVAIERFVVGRASMRSGSAGRVTRDLVGKLTREAEGERNVTVVQRSASQVKSWATDARLEAAGLLVETKGMTHARDAARHALFAACHGGLIPDPLSKNANHRGARA